MRYQFLYFIVILNYSVSGLPHLAYWVAWASSLALLVLTFTGWLVPYPQGIPWSQQLMRPLYLPQAIYVFYMSLTSPFAYFDALGFRFTDLVNFQREDLYFEHFASAQFYYLLFHIGMIHALGMASDYTKVQQRIYKKGVAAILFRVTWIATLLSIGFAFIPGLGQFQEKFSNLGAVGASISLALAFREKKWQFFILSALFWSFNMYKAVTSGWKEAVLVPLILIGAYLYPFYKRAVLYLGLPFVILIVILLPIYTSIVREQSWSGNLTGKVAAANAIGQLQSVDESTLLQSNWDFLAYRLSEIKLFIPYIEYTPHNRPYYGFQLINQAIGTIFPRILYPDKPVTETMVMERVGENKAVQDITALSAKPQLVVDGYLSFGATGAWLFGFLLGLTAARISVWLEASFGSYIIGSGLLFNGLFIIFWRGNCIEFSFGIIFWSFITAYLLKLFFKNLFSS